MSYRNVDISEKEIRGKIYMYKAFTKPNRGTRDHSNSVLIKHVK